MEVTIFITLSKMLAMWLFVIFALSVNGEEVNHRLLPVFPPGRIVGGRVTDISEVPYQLQLESQGFQFCGASILSANFALTAAHCTDGRIARELSVRYGSSFHATGGQVVRVAAIFQHPMYNARTTNFDVSVLRLSSPISIGPNAMPVTLAAAEPMTGSFAVVSGWGVQNEGSSSQPLQLQSITIPVMDRRACSSAYSGMITSKMICAGSPGHDSCQGDSGGPLVSGAGVQVGIVSWGYGCARPGYPGVYSNVAQLRSFIDAHSMYQAKWV